MRKIFAQFLLNKMQDNKNILLLTGDLGYGLFDEIRASFPDQFYNFGSSELTMVTAACGMAKENKIPYVYSITPFILFRPFEAIRNYIDHERTPVKLIGGGRNKEYGYLGFSHWGEDDMKFMNNFENILSYKPNDDYELKKTLEYSLNINLGVYINLKK
jgi:transketolase